jgi:hypothetical protein
MLHALHAMSRTCGSSWHRQALLASDVAGCYHCLSEFPPSTVSTWCDGGRPGQTAICPHCGVDAVVGFRGRVDAAWMARMHQREFD